LLRQRRSCRGVMRGPVKIALNNDVLFYPPSAARLGEGDVEIRQQVEPEAIGRADRRALLRPSLAGAALDIDLFCRPRIKQVLAELEVMKHGRQRIQEPEARSQKPEVRSQKSEAGLWPLTSDL